MTTMTDLGYANLSATVSEYFDIEIPLYWYQNNLDLFVAAISDFIDECNAGSVSDTAVRDQVADVLTRYFTESFDYWPTNMTSDVMVEKFYDEFEAGWKKEFFGNE